MNLQEKSNFIQRRKESKKRILVVEDEKFWVELLKLELESIRSNIEIIHAQNGEEAVELIKKSQQITAEEAFENLPNQAEGRTNRPEGFEEGEESQYEVEGKPRQSKEFQKAGEPQVKSIKYDAIITDIQMPIMDGSTAVKIIRDLLYTGPIIVWSAYRDSSEDLQKALDIPVSGFCVKEGTLQNLLMHLKNLKVIE